MGQLELIKYMQTTSEKIAIIFVLLLVIAMIIWSIAVFKKQSDKEIPQPTQRIETPLPPVYDNTNGKG